MAAFHFIVFLTAMLTTLLYVLFIQAHRALDEVETLGQLLWHRDNLKVFGIVYLMIVAVSWVRSRPLAQGGSYVARMVGGREVSFDTEDLKERQLINIVEEMGIASGMALPRVFVLDGESSINAFAAGTRISNACVAVSRGALERLSRDELQGVIAHEFSHILNGDMALNIHLLGYLYGLTSIADAGRIIMRSSSRSRNSKNNAAPVLGLGLFLIGSLGYFFAFLLRAGVSRDRERLADASAVQFTRNPDGIGGALKKIWKENMKGLSSARSSEISHFYLHWPRPFISFLATHPPILERIQNIGVSGEGIRHTEPVSESFDQLEAVSSLHASKPQAIKPEIDPSAIAFAFYFWFEGSSAIGREDLSHVIEELKQLSDQERFSLLEKSVARLREADATKISDLLSQMKVLIERDQHITHAEFVYYYYLGVSLRPEKDQRRSVSKQELSQSLEALGHFLEVLVPELKSQNLVQAFTLPMGLKASGRTQSSLAQVRSALQILRWLRPLQREQVFKLLEQYLNPYQSRPSMYLLKKLLGLILEIV